MGRAERAEIIFCFALSAPVPLRRDVLGGRRSGSGTRRLPWRASSPVREEQQGLSAYCVLGLSGGVLGPHRRVTPHLWRDPQRPRVESCTARICVTPQIRDKACYGEHCKLEPLVGRDLLLLVFCG